jgi:transposase
MSSPKKIRELTDIEKGMLIRWKKEGVKQVEMVRMLKVGESTISYNLNKHKKGLPLNLRTKKGRKLTLTGEEVKNYFRCEKKQVNLRAKNS